MMMMMRETKMEKKSKCEKKFLEKKFRTERNKKAQIIGNDDECVCVCVDKKKKKILLTELSTYIMYK